MSGVPIICDPDATVAESLRETLSGVGRVFVGLGPLRELKEIAGDLPLVAIGGINAENLPATLGAGADCAAIISELYRDGGSITNRFRHLRVVADVKHG